MREQEIIDLLQERGPMTAMQIAEVVMTDSAYIGVKYRRMGHLILKMYRQGLVDREESRSEKGQKCYLYKVRA